MKAFTLTLSAAAGLVAAAIIPATRAADKVDFQRDVKPIMESVCLNCHTAEKHKGDLLLDTRAHALKGGKDKGPSIVPGQPDKSPFYTLTILAADHDDLMPPTGKGGPLTKKQTDTLRAWIEQGAAWPDGLTLKVVQPKQKESTATADEGAAETALVAGIHAQVAANLKEKSEADMKGYKTTIPGTSVSFEMVPIKGGEFTMGSPDSEKGRKKDEGPQHKVAVSPFWMGKCEVTWNEFELWMFAEEQKAAGEKSASEKLVDAVSRPTKPYVDMTFGMGHDGYPAISMTQHAASKYCQWLSAKTGQFYRLPTEAEWEYACRACTTSAYSFGNDASKAGDYAWFEKNSNNASQKVGQKKPNPWGLHDMHGNVWEWALDQLTTDFYGKSPAKDPWAPSTKPYPQTIRGGAWTDDAGALRSAARRGSTLEWKAQDPQLPKSIWYHTDALFVGFRIVRPLAVPPPEEMFKYWNNGVEKD
ncbi:MAG: SUMF1/EgtB/PvdO family nonheme iron enzyme [Verrucomicrobia bacterium]|nr:SUMF1/EgtB/PvdO family nonheme iron enzyme [Verrucomicrobiota bacterium]